MILDGFGFDSAALTAMHRTRIAEIARQIARSQDAADPIHTVCLRGHTDTSGNAAYNQGLGTRRANAVRQELVQALARERPGVSSRIQIQVASEGEARPIAPETTPEGRARNRRVEVFLNNRWRGGGGPPSGSVLVALGAVRRSGEGDAEQEEYFTEDDPPEFVIMMDTTKDFIATGSPTPVGTPAYTWVTSDPAVATVTVVGGSAQTHPNRITIRGVAPGRSKVGVTYRDSGGRTATASIRIVVVRVTFPTLRDPVGVPVALPRLNPMNRPLTLADRRNGVASRTVVARFEPADFFNRRSARWSLTASGRTRGALPAAHATSLEAVAGQSFAAASNTSVIDATGNVTVRVNLPLVSFNKARLTVTSVDHAEAKAELDFEVPGIVVIDPGHGGNANVAGSSSNNATSTSGVLEKDMTLDFARRVRTALQGRADHPVTVHLTRDADVNVTGAARAQTARDNGADILVSIHFNANGAATRGTETFVRANANANVNRDEDAALARRVLDGALGAIAGGRDRGVRDDTLTPAGSLAVLSDISNGNTAAFHPIRTCLLEVEFITNAAVDALFNTAAGSADNRQAVCDGIAQGIVDDLAAQP